MTKVMALHGLDHYGTRRRGQVFEVAPGTAAELVQRGLVKIVRAPAQQKVAPKPIPKRVKILTKQVTDGAGQ